MGNIDNNSLPIQHATFNMGEIWMSEVGNFKFYQTFSWNVKSGAKKKKKNPEVGMVHRESAYNKYIPTYKYEYVSRYFMFDQIGLKNTIPQQTRPLKS